MKKITLLVLFFGCFDVAEITPEPEEKKLIEGVRKISYHPSEMGDDLEDQSVIMTDIQVIKLGSVTSVSGFMYGEKNPDKKFWGVVAFDSKDGWYRGNYNLFNQKHNDTFFPIYYFSAETAKKIYEKYSESGKESDVEEKEDK